MFKKNTCKIFLVLIIGVILSWIDIAEAQEKPVPLEKSIGLCLEEVSQLALENNLDIQIAKYDAYIKRNDIFTAVSIFDTLLSGSLSFTDDQTKSSSVFSGSKSTTADYKLGLSKKVPSGTILGVEFQNTRSWSDSSYSSVNPAHDARIKFSLSQPIGKNFFGLIDRGNIKITKLDITNSDYTSLNRIENDLADIQKAFWKLTLLEDQKAIKEDMFKKAEELYAIYKDKHQMGLVEDPGLFAAQANVNIRKNELLISQEQLEIAKNELLLMLNEEDLNLNIYSRDKLSVDGSRIDLVAALRDTVEKSRDYLKAKNDVEAKNIKLVIKKNTGLGGYS
jgi:outer membrane protein TolC